MQYQATMYGLWGDQDGSTGQATLLEHYSTACQPPTPTPTSCPIQFTDVPQGSTYYDYVRCLACRGIISGYADGTFRPNNLVTRGQVCKIATLAAQVVLPIPSYQQTFEDVPSDSTFWLYVERAYEHGIVTGYPCGGNANEPCVPPLTVLLPTKQSRYQKPGCPDHRQNRRLDRASFQRADVRRRAYWQYLLY